jgi:hypothetical protein
MASEQKEIELKYATLHYEAPIVFVNFKEGAELGFTELRELIALAEKLSGKEPYVVFSDASAGVQVTPEGRRISSNSKEAPLHMGSAILVSSNMQRAVINFFNGFQTPAYPFRAFTDKHEAIEWLLKLPLVHTKQNE